MIVLLAAALALSPGQSAPIVLKANSSVERTLAPGQAADAVIALGAGQSAEISVLQQGVDVVVEVFEPGGRLVDSVDSPNGRQGPEPVSLMARRAGPYRLHIRSIGPDEPSGRITIQVTTLRSAAETRELLRQRAQARSQAAAWLRRHDWALPGAEAVDRLAADARIIGLGEANHGSRELGDLRLSMVQQLVERQQVRVVAVEDSSSRWRALAPYVSGEAAAAATPLEWGWIGRRSRHELLLWVRQWNLAHPADRVRIIGVDPQDNGLDRAEIAALLDQAYGPDAVKAWSAIEKELATADEQTEVFGDSGVSAAARQALLEMAAQLHNDAPLLQRKMGRQAYDRALAAVSNLAAFADLNGGGALAHSRDWYMALAVARAVEDAPAGARAVYWAHNAHVSAAATRWGPTGALLRQAYGCGYRALAVTFGQGGFIAQKPNDPDDRLLAATLPAPAEETVEQVLAEVRPGAHLSLWGCGPAQADLPGWLKPDRPMHWVGGLFDPATPASGAYRSYRLTAAFDGVAYLPEVHPEAVPADRPKIPARQRN